MSMKPKKCPIDKSPLRIYEGAQVYVCQDCWGIWDLDMYRVVKGDKDIEVIGT